MKGNHLIWFGVLLSACYAPVEDGAEAIDVPAVYQSGTAGSVSVENDLVLENGKPYSGYLFQLFPGGRDTMQSDGYIHGRLNGVCRKWYPNGQLMERRHYSRGEKHGPQIAYWENGNKRFEFTAKHDAYEGELNEWTVEGKLIHTANFRNGQEEGPQKMWYDNGKIRANYVMIEGRRYGLLGTKNCKNVSDSIFNNR